MLLWMALTGCGQDLILAMGDPTGVLDAAARGRAAPVAADREVAFELPSDQPQIVSVPLAGDGTGVGGEAKAARPRFDPISVPQGPIEGTGVSFEGVSSRSAPMTRGALQELRGSRR